jgi:peroxiredoxin Q/BCP
MSTPAERPTIQVTTGTYGRVSKSHAATTAKVGDRIPDLACSATTGRTVELLHEVNTRHLVLFFYPGDLEGLRYPEMSGCTPEACMFRDKLSVLRGLGAEVFGVNLHSTKRQRSFVEREHLGFELLSDEDEALTNALGVPVWRSEHGEVFVTRTTLVVEQGGRIAAVFDDVQPAGHVDAVVAAVRALQS